MKVLFTTNIPSPYRVDFFNELSKYCELTVIFERKDAKDRNQEWLNNKNIKFNVMYVNGIKIGTDQSLSFEIIKFIKKNKFDIIVVGGYSTPTGIILIQYLKRKKINFIINCDGGFIKKDKKIKYKIKKYLITSAKYYITTGNETVKYLQYYGAKKENIFKYHFTSIKQEEIEKKKNRIEIENIKKILKIKEEKIILGVGTFSYRKGFDILIKAGKMIRDDIGIYLVGDNPTKEYLNLVKENNLKNIHFIAFKNKEKLKQYYEIADIFVLPTREDIWGLVINEAMAKSLPVITTNKCIAGLELVKNEENGYIIDSDNADELADKVNKLIKNTEKSRKMSENNYGKMQEYTIENMAKDHIEIFKEILNKEKQK